MIVKLRNPDRQLDLAGPLQVDALVRRCGLHPNAVLVIRDRDLLAGDDTVADADTVEIRPVISGGAR